MDEVGLGKALQRARKAAGLTQQQLCGLAGLSYSTLAKIERGAIQAPSLFTVHRIADALGLNLDQLVGGVLPTVAPRPKKVSKSGIRFAYFDVNGCLVRFYNRAFTRLAEDTGQSADAIETAFWHYNDAVCRGEISMGQFNQELGGRLGLPEFDWLQYYLAAIEPIEAMQQLVKWASANYEIGLLTNIMPGQLAAMIAGGIIPDLPYAAVIDSSVVGAIKPEPAIYEIATRAAQCQPGEILLVDDSRTNVMAAERAGWHVLWFDDYNPEEGVERVRATLEPAN
jgi:FMN phosphatase YigB (HAD superfamily)/DNA-binding XRE family transcriptional regulator